MAGLALVLGGGGMFGAYQAGVWMALDGILKPDMIVGASVGGLNGWAIAGGMSGAQLAEQWTSPLRDQRPEWRLPRSPRDSFLDASVLESWIRELHSAVHPRRRIGIALTEMWDLRTVLVEDGNISWRHLAASCAVPGFLPQYRIDGRYYADGGLLTALPLWAALQMGADRFVVIDVLSPRGFITRVAGGALRRMAGFRNPEAGRLRVLDLSPDVPLGALTGMIFWKRPEIERWMEQGRQTALEKKHLLCDMF